MSVLSVLIRADSLSYCRAALVVLTMLHPWIAAWYNVSYTNSMKTAISLPDELFALAETEAKKLGLSRSELYARALSQFVKLRQSETITERLNQVYSEVSSELDPSLSHMQILSLPPKEKW